jgi:hypothetical protein
MRETRLSGSEGGGSEPNRFSLPLSARRPQMGALAGVPRSAEIRVDPRLVTSPAIRERPSQAWPVLHLLTGARCTR